MIVLDFIPTLAQFVTVLAVLFFSIWFTPVFQRYILMMESFMLYPFICAKCTNFWINLIMNAFLAYIWSPWFLLWGGITSVVIAVMYWYSAKRGV